MTHLSRIWLNPLRSGAQKLIGNPQALHAAVLGGLSRQPVTERILWRLDLNNPRRAELLVLSESTPSWEHLLEQGGWQNADDDQAITRDYQPLLDKIQLGREFRFKLRANPVTSTRNPAKPSPAQQKHLDKERPRGVRVPHRTSAHQLTWLTDRIPAWGFEAILDDGGCPQIQLTARERVSFHKHADTSRHTVVLSTATFEGVLRVANPDAARATLLSGVGPARAYGCGLITLAPTSVNLSERS